MNLEDTYDMISVHEAPREVKFIERNSRLLRDRGCGEEDGDGESVFNGHNVSVLQDEKALERGRCWWLPSSVTMPCAAELATSK